MIVRRLATALALSGALAAVPGAAQQGPIRLFPEVERPPAEVTPPADPAEAAPPLGREATPTPAEPPGDFRVEGLAAPELDSIGLAGPGGFGPTLWQGSDPEVVLTLLGTVPVVTDNPSLRALTRRLLTTGASLEGGGAPGRLLEARVERLLAMGDLDAAKALVDPLPASTSDSGLVRQAAAVALLTDDAEAACRRASDVGATSQAAFWEQLTVYCRLVEGDRSGARLALDLLRERGQTDPAFFELAGSLVEGMTPASSSLAEPTAVEVALLRLAEVPLPPPALANASPAVLGVAVREPALAGNGRLELVERAFALGAASGDNVAGAYDDGSGGGDGDVLALLENDWSATTRARAYRAVDDVSDPAARAALLDAVWRAGRGAERLMVAEVFAQAYAEIPVEASLAATAPSMARAMLAADSPVAAARWFSVLNGAAAQVPARQSEAARLVPLFALAGVGGSDAVPRLDAATIAAWRQATPDADRVAATLFGLLEGVGAPVDADAWRHLLLTAPLQARQPTPAAALWRALDEAAAAGRLGDTVLFALHMLNGQPERTHPEVLAASLRALRRVGLDRDARAIAVATALTLQL